MISSTAISTRRWSEPGQGRSLRVRSGRSAPSCGSWSQALIGLAVLLQFNTFAIGLGLASLVVVAAYPFMKRLTSWPQAVLGLAFSWGALMGWAAALGHLDWTPLVLYAGTVAWVIGYDTIYACPGQEDDAVIGVRSTARLFGARTHRALVGVLFARGGA